MSPTIPDAPRGKRRTSRLGTALAATTAVLALAACGSSSNGPTAAAVTGHPPSSPERNVPLPERNGRLGGGLPVGLAGDSRKTRPGPVAVPPPAGPEGDNGNHGER